MDDDMRDLRDLYAGLAMLGEVTALRGKHAVDEAEVAKHAFDMADAMAAERDARGQSPVELPDLATQMRDVAELLRTDATARQTSADPDAHVHLDGAAVAGSIADQLASSLQARR